LALCHHPAWLWLNYLAHALLTANGLPVIKRVTGRVTHCPIRPALTAAKSSAGGISRLVPSPGFALDYFKVLLLLLLTN
jgi:hypothetical protein